MNIAAVIAWIATNPEIVVQGANAVINLVNKAISIFQKHGSPEETTAQLQAEWEAEGIDVTAASEAADKAGI